MIEYNKPFKVKIINSSTNNTWYKDKIGKTYVVAYEKAHGDKYYMVYPHNGNGIYPQDAIIVHDIKIEIPKDLFEI